MRVSPHRSSSLSKTRFPPDPVPRCFTELYWILNVVQRRDPSLVRFLESLALLKVFRPGWVERIRILPNLDVATDGSI